MSNFMQILNEDPVIKNALGMALSLETKVEEKLKIIKEDYYKTKTMPRKMKKRERKKLLKEYNFWLSMKDTLSIFGV